MPWHLRMITTIFLISLIPYIYIGFRLSSAASGVLGIAPKWTRIISFSLIFLCNLFPLSILFYSLGAGTLEDFFIYRDRLHWQDYVLLFPFWIGLITLIEIFPYYLVIDGINLFLRVFKSSYLDTWRKLGSWLQFGFATFFVLFVAIKSYWDTNRVVTRHYTIPVKNLPEGLKDINLALFADLQVDRYTQDRILQKTKQQFQKEKPDLLFFAGDLVTSGEKFIGQGINFMCGLEATAARVSCLGDHDYWSNAERIHAGLRNCGWNFLQNEHHIITRDNHRILVTGIVYIYRQRISPEQLRELLGNAPPADLKILLIHQPAEAVIQEAKEFGYHLIFAGHTHGGQIVFKPFGFSLTPSMFENGHYSGYKHEDDISLIVTNGIGLTLAPLRYNASAEISKINLVNKPVE